jgi:hypothetical protein
MTNQLEHITVAAGAAARTSGGRSQTSRGGIGGRPAGLQHSPRADKPPAATKQAPAAAAPRSRRPRASGGVRRPSPECIMRSPRACDSAINSGGRTRAA